MPNNLERRAIQLLDEWYDSLPTYANSLPSRGTISAALIVLNRLCDSYDLDIESHVSKKGQSQIQGQSASSLAVQLAKYGETRKLSAIGGRSNRGLRGEISSLLDRMAALSLERCNDTIRRQILELMQSHVVTVQVARFFDAQRVKVVFSSTTETAKLISRIIDGARKSGKAGAVAEHLVGAKLSLKFPGKVRNKAHTTADIQSGFEGDFEIGTTVFHVTVAPSPELYLKIEENTQQELRALVLVPSSKLAGAMQNVDPLNDRGIGVDSIELFVARNIDEHTGFEGGKRLKSGFRRLLEHYNERVDAVESDKSLLIDIPSNI